MAAARVLAIFTAFFAVVAAGRAADPGSPGRETRETYEIRGVPMVFLHFASPPLLILSTCRTGTGALKCIAYEKYRALRVKRSEVPAAGGRGPGGQLCQLLGGHGVVGLDHAGNENLFCEFADGSLISGGSLHARALENEARD